MALVEIVASNLHAGANLRKLEVGSVVDVDDATAERWISTGTGLLARWLMPQACQCSGDVWKMSSLLCTNFRLVLKRSGSWTR